jgi:hypothetical protein
MPQSPAWVILTTRYGEDIRQPSDNHLAQAVDELLNENIVGMTEADYFYCNPFYPSGRPRGGGNLPVVLYQ